MQELQHKQNIDKTYTAYERKALSEFDWMQQKENDATKRYQAMLKDKRLSSLKDTNPELNAQMPYLLAHAVNSMYTRQQLKPNEMVQNNQGLTPPKSVSRNAARPERQTSTSTVKQKEVGERFKKSGTTDDFIALRS